jgi:hypothetical protein
MIIRKKGKIDYPKVNYNENMKLYFVWNAQIIARDWYRVSDDEDSLCDEYEYNKDVYVKYKLTYISTNTYEYKSSKYYYVCKWLSNNNMLGNIVHQFTQNEYEFLMSCDQCKLLEFKYMTLSKPKNVKKVDCDGDENDKLCSLLKDIGKINNEIYIIFKKIFPKELINIILKYSL